MRIRIACLTGGFFGLTATMLWAAAPQGSAAGPAARELPPLELVQQIPVPDVAGRIDHMSADAKARLLVFAELGNHTVGIANTFDDRVVRTLKGLNEPQGVLYVPGFEKIFVANAGNRMVNIFDAKTFVPHKVIELGDDPDNVRWDEAGKRVYVGYGEDGTGAIAAFDAATETRVGKDLKTAGGHPESFQLEKKGTRIFVNVPSDDSTVQVLDRKDGKLTKWSLNGAKANFPMALDEDNHRLFIGTRRPPLLIVLDTDTGKEVARLPAVGLTDDLFYDAERKRIYFIGGEGFIRVYQQDGPNRYQIKANIPTAVGVRTGILSGTNLFVGVPAIGSQPAQIWTYAIPD